MTLPARGDGYGEPTQATRATLNEHGPTQADGRHGRQGGRDQEGEGSAADQAKAANLDGTSEQAQAVTLIDVIEDANWFSAQASTNIRYLAAGGVAAVWLLGGATVGGLRSIGLTIALAGFAAVMLTDFLHYSTSAGRLGRFIEECAERGCGRDSKVFLPPDAATPAKRWYAWKTGLLIAAYVALALSFVARVFPEVISLIARIGT